YDLFNSMMEGIKEESVGNLFNLQVEVQENPVVEDAGDAAASAPPALRQAPPAGRRGPRPAVAGAAGLGAGATGAGGPGARAGVPGGGGGGPGGGGGEGARPVAAVGAAARDAGPERVAGPAERRLRRAGGVVRRRGGAVGVVLSPARRAMSSPPRPGPRR